jgi:hypothetical protein
MREVLADGHHAAVSFDANYANEREFQLAKIREMSVKGFWFAFKIRPNTSGRKVMQGEVAVTQSPVRNPTTV